MNGTNIKNILYGNTLILLNRKDRMNIDQDNFISEEKIEKYKKLSAQLDQIVNVYNEKKGELIKKMDECFKTDGKK